MIGPDLQLYQQNSIFATGIYNMLNRLSINTKSNVVLITLSIVFLFISLTRYSPNLPGILSSDAEGYYMYLPALFIQRSMHHIAPGDMNYRKNDKGEVVLKYTCGVAYFYLPFFLGGHVIAHFQHLNAKGTPGFSYPYFYALIICGVFWTFAGLFFLKKLLLNFFSYSTTWITILCLLLGTNLFHYATISVTMSHIYSFALTSIILLLVYNFFTKPTQKLAIFISLLLGLETLIRPTNCLILIFLILFNIANRVDFQNRILFIKNHISIILYAIPFSILPMIPQFIYWKIMTGKWITYSYEGESFLYWKNPKILAVLFDTQNGLFLYSPILLLMFVGQIIGRKDYRTNLAGTLLTFISITWVFGSWWAWWFGGAFGHRCYIEYIPLFAFPFAVGIEKMATFNKAIKLPIAALLVFMIYYSISMSFIYGTTSIWDGPEWQWNYHKWYEEVDRIF